MNLLLPTGTLVLRELRHFYREKSRVIGVIVQPFLFWLLIGSGLNASFNPVNSDQSYMDYFFPGILLMVIMFTAIFSTFSIIEDRREGFLQGVLVSPAPRLAIVLGKVIGGALLGLAQGVLFLLLVLTPMIELSLGLVQVAVLIGWMLVVAALLTGLGVVMAWWMNSTQGYHSLMSVFLLPMWIFSGAAFPIAGAPHWLQIVMLANPLTHGLRLMRACFHGITVEGNLLISTGYVWASLILVIGAAIVIVSRKR